MTTASDRQALVAALGLPDLTDDEARLVDWLSEWSIGERLGRLIVRSRESARGEAVR